MMTRNSLPTLAMIVLAILIMLAIFTKGPSGTSGCNLPKMGLPTAPKTDPETGEIIEQPFENTPETGKIEPKTAIFNQKLDAATLRRVGAEALWVELSEAFQKGSDAPATAVLENTNWAALGLSPDEIAFYKSLRSLLNREGQDYSGDDWLRQFRNAGYIFGEVEAVFEKTAAGSAAQPGRMYNNPASLEKLTTSMQSQFNIDADKTDGFLRKYPQAGPGKWATLVFYLQN